MKASKSLQNNPIEEGVYILAEAFTRFEDSDLELGFSSYEEFIELYENELAKLGHVFDTS